MEASDANSSQRLGRQVVEQLEKLRNHGRNGLNTSAPNVQHDYRDGQHCQILLGLEIPVGGDKRVEACRGESK